MYLEHKDYETPETSKKIIPDVKEAIRAFVGTGRESYEDIVKHVQESENITNDNVITQIKEVSKEANFTKPVIKEVEELEVVEEL